MPSMPELPADAPAAVPAVLGAYLERLPAPHILFDADYRIHAANAAYRAQFAAPGARLVGRTCYQVSHHFDRPCDQAGETCPLARARASGRPERVLHLHHTPQGEAYVGIELIPLQDASGRPAWFVEKMEPLRAAQPAGAGQGLIGRAPAFLRMLDQVARVGPSQANVLLLGESGSGKELVARAVHEASGRVQHPFVAVECASLAETLFETELFGHERGAFTGASTAHAGLVEAAHRGTLFLDEVGDIPLSMQVKLLRLLESGTYRRVGATELRHADLRLVSATHRDLRALVAQGRFREDLYHRLATFPIRLPPLREREGDLPRLAQALLARVAEGAAASFTPAALRRLERHPFPGNVRELRNVVERALLLSDGACIDLQAVDAALGADDPGASPGRLGQEVAWRRFDRPAGAPAPEGAAAPPAARRSRLAPTDAQIHAELARQHGHRAATAQALGVSERTLYRRLRARPQAAHAQETVAPQPNGEATNDRPGKRPEDRSGERPNERAE